MGNFGRYISDAEIENNALRKVLCDLVTLMHTTHFINEPNVLVSDDGLGIVTLHWREKGVAILLAGDGIATVSYSDLFRNYCDNSKDYPVKEALPLSVAV